TAAGIPTWSPTVVLICRSTAYVWQSGRDAQFSADCGHIRHVFSSKETQENDKDENAAERLLTANILGFVKRHWIKRELDEKRKDVYTIEDLHRKLWKEETLQIQKDEPLSQELQALTAAATVLRGKAGGKTAEEKDQVEGVVKSLSSLGLSIDGHLEAT
ncbi:hypothetical protein KCU81_g10020, partial [Aureobasidium melanogenum]